ncbi:MAG: glycosyltransferase, partial [Actinobacteria bacterium]|nr:glycosyltransferase [Actinomycetota bacterium]
NDLSGKQKCKENLIKELFKNSPAGKETFSKPLLGMVSRLSEQKGIDLIVTAMDKIMQEQDLFIVILGTGDEKYQNLLLDLCKRYERKLSIIIGFSEKLSREIYAGSDIFLMPSKYEPCGLGQLISLKYGTIPLVRNTGGLADTIIDIQDKKDIVKGGQGFKFNDYDWNQFYLAILRAVNFYRDKNSWEKIILNGMNSDFSWDYSAIKYKELYESLV